MAADGLIGINSTVPDARADRIIRSVEVHDPQASEAPNILVLGCVSQIVLLGGRIKDFGTISFDDCNGFAEIIA